MVLAPQISSRLCFFLFLQLDTVTPAYPSATLLTPRSKAVILLKDNLVMKSGFKLMAQALAGPRAWRSHCPENMRLHRCRSEVTLALSTSATVPHQGFPPISWTKLSRPLSQGRSEQEGCFPATQRCLYNLLWYPACDLLQAPAVALGTAHCNPPWSALAPNGCSSSTSIETRQPWPTSNIDCAPKPAVFLWEAELCYHQKIAVA